MVTVLAILTAVVVAAVGGIRSEAEEAGCDADRYQLATAVESYFAQRDTTSIPDAGGAEGYEQTLVDSGFLRETSTYHDLTADGQLIPSTGFGC